MAFITNSIFTQTEIRHLEFLLPHPFPKCDQVVAQLKQLNEPELQQDYTPYFHILNFRPGGANAGSGAITADNVLLLHPGKE